MLTHVYSIGTLYLCLLLFTYVYHVYSCLHMLTHVYMSTTVYSRLPTFTCLYLCLHLCCRTIRLSSSHQFQLVLVPTTSIRTNVLELVNYN